MKTLGARDLYEVKAASLLFDEDNQTLVSFYLPLIGPNALAIYMALAQESKKEALIHSHSSLFTRLQLSAGQFVDASRALEATGLLRSYLKEDNKTRLYRYELYAPKSPKEFLDDPLLRGTLALYLGEDSVLALEKEYEDKPMEEGFVEVSESFLHFFRPDLQSPIYKTTPKKTLGRKNNSPKDDFDLREFEIALSERLLTLDSFSEEELKKISRLASLYRFSAKDMASWTGEFFDSKKAKGQRLDFIGLKNRCEEMVPFGYLRQEKGEKSEISSKSDTAAWVDFMENNTPAKFLSYLQNGHKPAQSDLKILDNLAINIGLPDGVINALIDYALRTNNNVLSFAYCEKLGAALARVGAKSARDAMDYLSSSRRRFKKKETPSYEESKEAAPEEDNAPVSDEEVDAALKDLFGE